MEFMKIEGLLNVHSCLTRNIYSICDSKSMYSCIESGVRMLLSKLESDHYEYCYTKDGEGCQGSPRHLS